MRNRFYRRLKIGGIVFISPILFLILVSLAFDIHDRKLLLYLFPRPALSAEALENYWQNPLPPPKTLRDIVTQTKNGDSFCIYIVATELWVIGDEDPDVYFSVQNSFELYIDGIYRKPPYITQSLAVFSDNKAGGKISACIELEGLAIGLHSAEVQFSDTREKIYTHTWAFKVTS